MKDKLGNIINTGDRVVFAWRFGRNAAELMYGFVLTTGGALLVDVQNRQLTLQPRNVIVIPDSMIPELRMEKLNDTKEAVVRN